MELRLLSADQFGQHGLGILQPLQAIETTSHERITSILIRFGMLNRHSSGPPQVILQLIE